MRLKCIGNHLHFGLFTPSETENKSLKWHRFRTHSFGITIPYLPLQTNTWLDISSHNVGLSALSIKQPDCHGYLTKMGNKRKNWKRRYCVLKDACLYYYLDVNSTTAQGKISFTWGLIDEDFLAHNLISMLCIFKICTLSLPYSVICVIG